MKREDIDLDMEARRVWEKGREAPKRRFRIWDNTKRKNLSHNCYGSLYNAARYAAVEILFAPVGNALTVYDVKDGMDLYTFKHHANGDIGVVRGKNPPKE